jgi:hypothetical protein
MNFKFEVDLVSIEKRKGVSNDYQGLGSMAMHLVAVAAPFSII